MFDETSRNLVDDFLRKRGIDPDPLADQSEDPLMPPDAEPIDSAEDWRDSTPVYFETGRIAIDGSWEN